MPTKQDTISGKLAIMLGFCKPEHVDDAMKVQAGLGDGKAVLSLPHILLKQKTITSMQYRMLNIATRYELDRDEDMSLAKFILKNGWATESQIKDLLGEQDPLYREGKAFPRLERLLIEGAVLDESRLERAKKMMGGLSSAVRHMQKTGLTSAPIPALTGRAPTRRTTLRTESLIFEHCRVMMKQHAIKDGKGEEQKVFILNVSGQLDAHSFGAFDEFLQEMLEKDKFRIVMNLEKLTYISSAGMGTLGAALTQSRDRGGDIRLCSVPEDIHKILQMVGLHEMMDIHDTEPEAIESFQGK